MIAGCTDEIQVVDAGLGALIKRFYEEVVQEWFQDDRNWEEWTGANLTASRKRVLTTHWYGEAYNRACSSYNFAAAFDHTGSNLTADGSGDHLLKLQGLDDFSFTLEDAKRHPISGEFVEDEGDVPVESAALQADRAAGDSDHSENEEFSEKEGNNEEGESDDDDCSTDQEEGPAFEPEEDMIVEEEYPQDGRLEGKSIAHRFDVSEWYVGTVRRKVTCSANREENGRYATKYPNDRKEYFHDLYKEDYGVTKIWVSVRSKT